MANCCRPPRERAPLRIAKTHADGAAKKGLAPGIVLALLILVLLPISVSAQRILPSTVGNSAADIPKLLQDLKSPELEFRKIAACKLSTIYPLPDDALLALAAQLQSAEPYGTVQGCAASALAKAGERAIPIWIAIANGPSPAARGAAIMTLGRQWATDPRVWPVLINSFTESSSPFAVGTLSQLAVPQVVAMLQQALKDNDPHMRAGAAATLARMGEMSAVFAERMKAEPDDQQTAHAAAAVASVLRPAAGAIAKALKDADENTRNLAAIALAYADPEDGRSAPILIALLKDRAWAGRAIEALQKLGADGKEIAPALEETLVNNPSDFVRKNAARPLAHREGPQACAALTHAATTDSADDVRIAAVEAMGEITPGCPQRIAALVATLAIKDSPASGELSKIGQPAVPALSSALSSTDFHVRGSAVQALANMQPLSPEAVQALMIALKDDDRDIRTAAATALGNAGGAAQAAATAELQREANEDATVPDTRVYTIQELAAPISFENEEGEEESRTLSYLIPIGGESNFGGKAGLLAAFYHSNDEGFDLLIFLRKTDDDHFQKVHEYSPNDPRASMGMPVVFSAIVDFSSSKLLSSTIGGAIVAVGGSRERVTFVNVPVDGWGGRRSDRVFAVDHGGIQPVQIESPERRVEELLGPQEDIGVAADQGNQFKDDHITFDLPVGEAGDREGHWTGGHIRGTYKAVRRSDTDADGKTTTTWTMAVDTVEREPPATPRPAASGIVAPSPFPTALH